MASILQRILPRLVPLAAVAVVVVGPRSTNAQTAEQAPVSSAVQGPSAKPKGLLPIPDYSGDWLDRAHLAGDFGGARTDLAEKGFQFHIDWVQTLQSVVDGGRDTGTKYGGSLDYLMFVDLDRMGLLPGALVKLRAETRYAESVNTMSGSILPVNTDGFFPLESPSDTTIPITVTDLVYYQYLSEKFALMGGKFDTLDSDLNEFASGRGNSQFLNTQLIFAGTMSLMPYSTVGGGVIVMPTKHITVSSLVFNLTDASTTTGLTDFGDGTVWATEAGFQYRVGALPGGSNVGVAYLWDTEFFNFGGRFSFDRGEGLVAPNESDTWMVYVSGWQYVFAQDAKDGPMNLANGEPDHEGFGVFWRGSIADDEVNPVEWSLSGGVGGKGIIPSRERDFYGVGYYYNQLQTSRLTNLVGLDDRAQGFEAFYNLAITPAAQVTFDAQLIESAQENLDTAVILGMRLKLEI